MYLAQDSQAFGCGEVLIQDAGAGVLDAQPQEPSNGEHKGDVQAGDAEGGQRSSQPAPLNSVQHSHQAAHQFHQFNTKKSNRSEHKVSDDSSCCYLSCLDALVRDSGKMHAPYTPKGLSIDA